MLSKSVISCAIAAALSLVSFVASADEAATDLPHVVVTATRTAQTQDQTLASMTVITREDIDLLQPASLMDLLAATPGMSMSDTGGPGKSAGLYLRGTSASQLAVLVDGVRVGLVSAGAVAFSYIPLDQVERVEIVRGPFSSLYGSDAIGGVVQIFMRHAAGSFVPNVSVTTGSWATRKASAGLSSSTDNGWISVQASHHRTDGINACRMGAASAFAGCYADQPDRDGFLDNALSLTAGYRFNEAWSVDGVAMRSEGWSDYDGLDYATGLDYKGDEFITQSVGGQLRFALNQRVKFSLRGGSSMDSSTYMLKGALGKVESGHINSRRNLGSLQTDIDTGNGLVTLGYDWEQQKLDSNVAYSFTGRTIRGAFAQWQAGFGAQSLQANLRRDDNSQYGHKTTGSLLWGLDLSEALRLTANYGTAFRAPTFNDLYYPGYANPNLMPETSRNVQFGLRGTKAFGYWSVEAYRNDIRDMITFDAATYKPANIGRAHIQGIEAVLGAKLGGFDVRATATVMRSRNDSSSGVNDNKLLPRRPERSARLDVDRTLGAFTLGGGWSVASRRFDDIGNQHSLGGYGLLDLRAGWKLNTDWQLQLSVDNVLDKNYETAWYFNQPRRNFMLTLNWRPSK